MSARGASEFGTSPARGVEVPPSRGRRVRAVQLAVGAVIALTLLSRLVMTGPEIAPGATAWFRVPSVIGQTASQPNGAVAILCREPDGPAYSIQVVDLLSRPQIGVSVRVAPRPGRVAGTLAALGLRELPRPQATLMTPIGEVATGSGTWMECTFDVLEVGERWHPADLVGTWVHRGRRDGEVARYTFRPDGAVVDTDLPERRVGTWAGTAPAPATDGAVGGGRRAGHLFVRWERSVAAAWAFHQETFRLSDDRRSYEGLFDVSPSLGGERDVR